MKFNEIIVNHPKKGKTTINRLSKEEIFHLVRNDLTKAIAERNYALKLLTITRKQRDYFLERIRKRDGKA
jgi:hypothetical protein